MSRFLGRKYLHNGRVIGVTQGLGSEYIIAYYSPSGGKHRVRNYAKLKVYDAPDEAQQALDKFAAEQGLLEVESCGD